MEKQPESPKGMIVGAAEAIGSIVGHIAAVGKSVVGSKDHPSSQKPAPKTRIPRKLKKAKKKAAMSGSSSAPQYS
jgi:hypothetical protein